MVDFNEIQLKQPQLDSDYWKNQKPALEKETINTIFDENTNATLEDISIFGKK